MQNLLKEQKEIKKKQNAEEKDLNKALRIQNLEAGLEEEKEERRKATLSFQEEIRKLKLDMKEDMLELKSKM
eukprot:10694398-Karenia_brevis.AAC.1